MGTVDPKCAAHCSFELADVSSHEDGTSVNLKLLSYSKIKFLPQRRARGFIAYWKYEEEGGMAGLGGDADAHPYICFTINLV
ncbi:hypothetical protein Vadar_012229 [Vaccinium darrowii]|uniref:Uncharacterized protein n=1 Tax=Vaccinium darrowii TaxID=229202 RepID=A0ACB7XQ80_9ERIC|nr:hypothetical protein Vadar_012229 [Vaccinium darrowii]